MKLVYYIFHGLCHQMPLRELTADGFSTPMCARCAGMYVGFFLALPFFVFVGRKRRNIPTIPYIVLSAAAFSLFAADATANFVGIWEGGSAVRFAAGMLVGVFLSPYIALLFHNVVENENLGPSIADSRSGLFLSGAVAAVSAANVRPSPTLLMVESYAAAVGVFMLLVTAHAAVLTLILGGRRRKAALAAAPVTVALQLAAFSLLRSLTGV